MTWLELIEGELAKIEPYDDLPPLTQEDSPQYLKNAERLLAPVVAPSINFKGGGGLNATRLGGIIGHKIAYVKPFVQGLRISKNFPAATPKKLVKEAVGLERDLKKYYPRVLRTARRCIGIALEQSLTDSAEFMFGLARALQKGSLDSRGGFVGATTATEFYVMLLCVGPRLQYAVKSLNHLHQVCVRLFGRRAGDLKTTEKRCQRIGLSFGRRGVSTVSAIPSDMPRERLSDHKSAHLRHDERHESTKLIPFSKARADTR
jgi:hypothetical protein